MRMSPRWVTSQKSQHFVWMVALTALPILNSMAFAEEAVPEEEVTVEAVKKGEQSALLPDVQGTAVYAGKKATQTSLRRIPPVINNNYRQAFYQMPGLLVSELSNRSIVNINYRGIGDPHESQDILTLKDGIPIGMDRLGYSTTYYTPPLESVEHLELIRGGGALLYGPQPGPVLNYITYDPPAERWSLSTQHTVGSYGTYSTFNRVGGTVDPLGYLAYQYHSHSNGPRANEGFDISGGTTKLIYHQSPQAKWTLNIDAFESETKEPGRLSLAQYQTDRRQTPRPGDRLEASRYAASLKHDREVSPDTLLSLAFYGNTYDRWSLRRTNNTSTQNNLDRREVSSGGTEGRLRHEYQAFGDTQTLTAGGTFYFADAPRFQDRSATGTYPSELGNPIFDFDYRTVYGTLFGENRFAFGPLSVTPGFRLDLLSQRVRENFNTGKTSPFHNINEFSAVPLVGLGLQYELPAQSFLYANVSQGYKPAQFDDLAPTGNNTLPATSLEEGKTWNYEAGVKGTPAPWTFFDGSLFLADYDNYFGTVTVGSNTQRQNVGRAVYSGVDFSGELDLIRLADTLNLSPQGEKPLTDRLGSLSLYGNVSFLSAEFKSGPLKGNEPAFAPDYLARVGVIYRGLKRIKIALMGNLVGDHFWADNNQPGTTGTTGIPAYTTWDLTGDLVLLKDRVNVLFGVNNLFDEIYFSRVRSDGIEPAPERNYYAGVKVSF